jgi:hypothetical protein
MWKVNHVFAHRATTGCGRVTRPDGGVVTESRSSRHAGPGCFLAGEYAARPGTVQMSPVGARVANLGKGAVTVGEIGDLSNS